jgi:hypothetical protein
VHAWQVHPTPDLELPTTDADHWIDRWFLDPEHEVWERFRDFHGLYTPGALVIGLIAVIAGKRHITRFWGGRLALMGGLCTAVIVSAFVLSALGLYHRF